MSDINELRSKIDEITIDMIKMLKKRNGIVKEIGEIKKNAGKVITDEKREDNLRTKVVSLCNDLWSISISKKLRESSTDTGCPSLKNADCPDAK